MKTEKKKNLTKKRVLYVVGGLFVGFLSGFFGGGGGMLVVPLLVFIGKLEEKHAHATAIAVILPLCIVSGLVYVLGGNYDISVGIPTGIAFVVGGAIGSFALKKIPTKLLGVIFSILMIAGGVRLLW